MQPVAGEASCASNFISSIGLIKSLFYFILSSLSTLKLLLFYLNLVVPLDLRIPVARDADPLRLPMDSRNVGEVAGEASDFLEP